MAKLYSNSLRKLLPALIIVLAAITVWAAKDVSAHRKAKADFFMRQASKQEALGKQSTFAHYVMRAAEQDPSNAYAAYMLGTNTANPKHAVEKMTEYVEAHDMDPYIVMPYLNALYQLNRIDSIFPYLDKLERVFPENLEILDVDLTVSERADSIDRMMRIIDRIELLGNAPEQVAYLRIKTLSTHEPVDTIGIFKIADSLTERYPESLQGNLLWAFIRSAYGQDSAAISFLDKKAAAIADNFDYRMQMAEIHIDAGDSINAQEDFIKALDSENFDMEQFCKVVSYLSDNVQMPILKAAEARFPNDTILASVFFSKAFDIDSITAATYREKLSPMQQSIILPNEIYNALQQGNPAKAVEIYNANADNLPPEYTEATMNLIATAYVQLGDSTNFFPIRDEVIRKALPGVENIDSLKPLNYIFYYPDAPLAHNMYLLEAELYHNLNDLNKTIRASQNAILTSYAETKPMALNNYAYFVATATSDPELLSQALEMAKESVKMKADLNNLDTLAWILHLLGKDEQALKFFEPMMLNADIELLNDELFDHIEAIYKATGHTGDAVLSRRTSKQ